MKQLRDLGKRKSIKDSVHGYIKLPCTFFTYFIDTPIFQRLRNIEQTGMRVLFPSARHDRFIHSIGTCFLGMKAYESLYCNLCDDDIMAPELWDRYYLLFSIACLMHDCGHSPFSHSLEYVYDLVRDSTETSIAQLDYDLLTANGSTEFALSAKNKRAKPHEKMSALVVKRNYDFAIKVLLIQTFENGEYHGEKIDELSEENINQLEIDEALNEAVDFVMRSILGYLYPEETENPMDQIKNCFINLLNSENFDMDSLDYIVRDSQMAGLNNFSIDVDRILNALTFTRITKFNDIPVSGVSVNSASCHLILTGDSPTFDGFLSGSLTANKFEAGLSGHIDMHCKHFSTKNRIAFSAESARFNGGIVTQDIPACMDAEIDINASIKEECFILCDDICTRQDFNGKVRTISAGSPITLTARQINGHLSGIIGGEILSIDLDYDKESKRGIETYVLAYDKSSLSILQNIVGARNYEYLWIYGHHKVAYYSNYLLPEIVRLAAKVAFDESSNDKHMIEIINYDTVTNVCRKGEWSFGLISDADIMFFVKQVYYEYKSHPEPASASVNSLISLSEEFAQRKFRKSIWKSYAEYNSMFSRLSESQKEQLMHFIKNEMSSELHGPGSYGNINDQYAKELLEFGLSDVLWVSADVTIKNPEPSSIYIKLYNTTSKLSDLLPINENSSSKKLSITYLYYKPCEKSFDSNGFIRYLESIVSGY